MRPALTLLRELRPDLRGAFDPDAPAAAETLARILDTPPAPPPRRPRRNRRRMAVAVALAAVCAAVLALAPVTTRSPDVIARAAAALSEPESILHFKAEIRHRSSENERTMSGPDERVDQTLESWQTGGVRRERQIWDGGALEWVTDRPAKLMLSYSAERNEIVRHTESDLFKPISPDRQGLGAPTVFGGLGIGDLAALLERARRGEGNATLVGETDIRGIPVYEIRIDFTVESVILPPDGKITGDPRDLPTEKIPVSRLVYVERERFLPVRVVERGPGELVSRITDYTLAERIPLTPETEHLLEMSPHPGAKEITEGPF